MTRVIGIIVVIFFIIMLNLRDFDNLLNRGASAYIQYYSGMLASNILLLALAMLIGIEDVAVILFICVIYIIIYTLIYFKVKKIKKEREKRQMEKIRQNNYGKKIVIIKQGEKEEE